LANFECYHANVDITWSEVQLFLAVAESGSLTAAARKLGVAQPTVSRRLAELEATVGEALFSRGVEGATLTSFGETLVSPARRMAEWAGELERAVQRADAAPRGVVRITAPPGIAFDFLAPFAAWLRGELPEIRLEVVSSIRYLDLSRREADLALRTQQPMQRDVATLGTFVHSVAPFAARSYVERLRKGYGVADVDWIGWAPPYEDMRPNSALAALIPDFRPAFASDDFVIQLRAAEAGLGGIFLGRTRHRFSQPSSLEELDLDLGPLRGELHLACARSALDVPRIRAVADLLLAELQRAETWGPKKRPK
jgi:DNA-binding transcriptional LysR family regulator